MNTPPTLNVDTLTEILELFCRITECVFQSVVLQSFDVRLVRSIAVLLGYALLTESCFGYSVICWLAVLFDGW